MKKTYMMALTAMISCSAAWADDYVTAGNGTEWTMTRLAATEGTGVTAEGSVFTMTTTVVVARGDRFVIEDGITVKMAKDVSLEVEGTASLDAQERVLFTRSDKDVAPNCVYIKSDDAVTTVRNIDFEYAGLRNFGSKGLIVDNCTFRYHEASTSHGTSALSMCGEGAEFTVTNSTFEYNKRSAIGGASNASNSATIENCVFRYNDSQNLNYPQLNLTAAKSIVVRGCEVTGDRTKTRGGGIMVADLLSVASDPHTLIEDNRVADNRYGVALYSGQTALVRNNLILNNDTETTPNNGGSGINIYDVSGTQQTTITGNHIEGNLWGVTIIGGKTVNMGKTDKNAEDWNPGENTFLNNGNGGMVYDVYNNSANTVYAQGNYWLTAATQNAEGIEAVIFHKADDSSLGEVIFTPWGDVTATAIELAPRNEPTAEDTDVFSIGGQRMKAASRGISIVKRGKDVIKVMRR